MYVLLKVRWTSFFFAFFSLFLGSPGDTFLPPPSFPAGWARPLHSPLKPTRRVAVRTRFTPSPPQVGLQAGGNPVVAGPVSNPAHEVNHLAGPWNSVPLARSLLVGEHRYESRRQSRAPRESGSDARLAQGSSLTWVFRFGRFTKAKSTKVDTRRLRTPGCRRVFGHLPWLWLSPWRCRCRCCWPACCCLLWRDTLSKDFVVVPKPKRWPNFCWPFG